MNESYRKEIMPDVSLTSVKTDKFKTGFMSITIMTPINKKTAALNALLPSVLRRGTLAHPGIESIGEALDELYGARIEPQIRKKGEYQCIGFWAEFVDDDFLPKGENVLEKVTALMGEILLSPNTSGGRLKSEYVADEKEKLLDEIKGVLNDKRQYSVMRLTELMCENEPYGVFKLGSSEAVSKITAASLTKHYRELIAHSSVEVFYCGSAGHHRVESAVREAIADLPRFGAPRLPETVVLYAPPKGTVREIEERFDVTQGKLAVGFRVGEAMKRPDYAALMVFNAVYGGAVTSKLFMNVREKLSLCYFASSALERFKGIMIVSSGIEFENYRKALDEILGQLDAVKRGEIEDWELNGGRQAVINSMKTVMDDQRRLENFYFDRKLMGIECTPEDMAALAACVTKEDVVKAASGVMADTVYFLTGKGEEAE